MQTLRWYVHVWDQKKNGQNNWSQHASFATHLKDYHVNTTKHTLHVKVESHVAWAAKLEEQGRQASNSGPSLAHHFTRPQEMHGDPLAEAKKHRTTVEWMVDFGIPHEALLDPRFEQIQMRQLPLVPAKNKLKDVIKGVATINREETTSLLRHKDSGLTWKFHSTAVCVFQEGTPHCWALIDLTGRGQTAEDYKTMLREIVAELRANKVTAIHVVSDGGPGIFHYKVSCHGSSGSFWSFLALFGSF